MPRYFHRIVPLASPVVIGGVSYSRYIDDERPMVSPTIVADVTGASTSAPIVLSSTLRSGFAGFTRGQITVAGVNGNTAANGTWFFTSGDPIVAVSNGMPIAITTSGPHNLSSGLQVTIPSSCGNPNAIGTWTITVTSSTSFTLNGSGGGTAAGPCDPYSVVGGVVLIGSTANGSYSGGGTVTRNEIIGQVGSASLLADGALG